MNSIPFCPSIRLVWTFRANFPVARCANLLRTLFFAAPRSLHCLQARSLISSCLDWPRNWLRIAWRSHTECKVDDELFMYVCVCEFFFVHPLVQLKRDRLNGSLNWR